MVEAKKIRLLIGYSGTPIAKAAIDDLARAGLPGEADVLVLATTCESLSPNEAQARAAEGAALAKSLFPGWSMSTQTSIGDAAREITSVERSFKPDLIVLGEWAEGTDGPTRSHLGPIATDVLKFGEASLRVTRTVTQSTKGAPGLLVPFDGSDQADKTIAAVASRSWPRGTSVRLLSMDDTGVLGTMKSLSPQLRAAAVGAGFASRWAETLASKALKQLSDAGLQASVETISGDQAIGLADGTTDPSANCVFVGSAEMLNSYEQVLRRSPSDPVATCTVELVR